jgi:hypothetical protein
MRRGLGLVGLTDRVEALGGSIRVSSRPGEGTQIAVELPLELMPADTGCHEMPLAGMRSRADVDPESCPECVIVDDTPSSSRAPRPARPRGWTSSELRRTAPRRFGS